MTKSISEKQKYKRKILLRRIFFLVFTLFIVIGITFIANFIIRAGYSFIVNEINKPISENKLVSRKYSNCSKGDISINLNIKSISEKQLVFEKIISTKTPCLIDDSDKKISLVISDMNNKKVYSSSECNNDKHEILLDKGDIVKRDIVWEKVIGCNISRLLSGTYKAKVVYNKISSNQVQFTF